MVNINFLYWDIDLVFTYYRITFSILKFLFETPLQSRSPKFRN
jgi:hypothetical protein